MKITTTTRLLLLFLWSVLLLSTLLLTVNATDIVWSAGQSSDNWHLASNWNPASVPGQQDNALIQGLVTVKTTYQPEPSISKIALQTLTIGGGPQDIANQQTTMFLFQTGNITQVTVGPNSSLYHNSGMLYWSFANRTNVMGHLYIYEAAYDSLVTQNTTGIIYLGMGNRAYINRIVSVPDAVGGVYVFNSSVCQIWSFDTNYLSINISQVTLKNDQVFTVSRISNYLRILESSFLMTSHVVLNNSFSNMIDSNLTGVGINFYLLNSTMNMTLSDPAPAGKSVFNMNSGIIKLADKSSLYLYDTAINSIGTSINVTDGSVLSARDVFSDINLKNGHIFLSDSRFTFVDHVWVTISGGILFTMGNSSIRAATNSVLDIQGTIGSCLATGNTDISIEDDSSVFLKGHMLMTNNSAITIQQQSFIYVEGLLIMYNKTKVLSIQSEFYVEEGLSLYDESTVTVIGSYLSVTGDIYLFDNTAINLLTTIVEVPGTIAVSSLLTATASNITVMGDIFSDGVVDLQANSWLIVTGVFISINYTKLNLSVIGTHESMKYGGQFIGIDSAIAVVAGDLIILPGTNFSCSGCGILVQGGSFTYSADSSVVLIDTYLETESGANLISDSDIYTFPGSSITNAGTFTLSRNIEIPTVQHPLFEQYRQVQLQKTAMGIQDTPLELTNSGTLDSTADISIGIQLNNQGKLQVKGNNIKVAKVVQKKGSIIVGGGSMSSNNTIDIQGGAIQGQGQINGDIQQSGGSIGTVSQTSDKLNINGSLEQNNSSTIIVTINTIDDFSQLNISNNANFSGTIEIRVAKNLTESNEPINIPVMNYGQSNGDFSKINIITYDPDTGKEDDEPNCKVSSQKGGSKYSVLVSECQSSSSMSKTMTGVIVGVVVGIVSLAAIAGGVYHYRKRLAMHMRYRKERASVSLGKIRKSFRDN
ncbi:hypothetical protein DFA_08396 [Cavenderia fasciculata]|uniref:Transmembrane protein n=1 Tax=Cavenderia fasciculata TaxID=261658 RepID=F4Q5Z2_CACFS|nr:uncharacterized protein DFA_08396 [Cavenderia fasciculata]EGG17401.1 hypothetical protein DFA_08396 [Cavenderia fasciculata]|eukprot:XP_004355885.1 hypothetical protein DFA_08396 [Cavenderia fasciculata]